jgi:DNA polymerase-1
VPGVPGIGQKTAVSLIRAHNSMENLYDHLDAVTGKKQRQNLIEYKEQAFLSRELVTINLEAPVTFTSEDFMVETPDDEQLIELFKTLEFRQLHQSLSQKTDLAQKAYNVVMDPGALNDLISRLEEARLFALDSETTSENPMKAEIVGLSFAFQPNEAYYIPCRHDYPDAPKQLKLNRVLEAIRPVLENPEIKKVGQNIKYDWMVLKRHGVDLKGVFFDTMLASYLINPSKRAHNLNQIALDFLNHKTTTYEEVAGKGKNAVGFDAVTLDKAVPYACEDADVTYMAHQVLAQDLDRLNLTTLLEEVELPLIPVLMGMEMRGIRVDKKKLRDLSGSFQQTLEELEGRIYSLAGETFNVKSSQQLGHILFDKLKLPVQKKTKKKTGYSTDMNVLTILAEKHELPGLVLKHRTLAKLKSTYADALLELINPETGRIHTSFNQTVTATGRLSSSEPNLQNIPIRTEEGREIRKAFVPRSGWKLVSADYSQVELRILAHYSDDPVLIDAFNSNEDIHTRTACEVFQVFPSFITPELRRQAKAINFGIIYGMSPFGLSKQLKISQKMAKAYMDNYFRTYKGVKQFMDQTIADARKTKQTATFLGRIRLLPEIDSANRNIRQFAERTAINTPIQGTAADLIKLAMIDTKAALEEKGLKAAMLLSVHDELVFEAPPEEIEPLFNLVRKSMEGIWDLKVPLKVNLASGGNWNEAH